MGFYSIATSREALSRVSDLEDEVDELRDIIDDLLEEDEYDIDDDFEADDEY